MPVQEAGTLAAGTLWCPKDPQPCCRWDGLCVLLARRIAHKLPSARCKPKHVAGGSLLIQNRYHRLRGSCRTVSYLTTLIVLPVVLGHAQQSSTPRRPWGSRWRSRYAAILLWHDSQAETRHGEADRSRHVLALATSEILWLLALSSLPHGLVLVWLFHCPQGVRSLPPFWCCMLFAIGSGP